MGLKRCKQCGILKDEVSFRQYTYAKSNGTKGRYRICRDCENINSTMRRLLQQFEPLRLAESEETHSLPAGHQLVHSEEYMSLKREIDRIQTLYDRLKEHGLQVPAFTASQVEAVKGKTVHDQVDQLLNFYDMNPYRQAEETTVDKQVTTSMAIPDELNNWLTQGPQDWIDAGLSPEYLQDVVYEALKAKYRPQLGFDTERMVPIYDDQFKDVLNDILRRFDEYEEAVASDGEQEG